MIYLIDEEGWYGGGYYATLPDLMGAVKGRSRDEIIENGYESLELLIEDINSVPFDRTDIKGSVVFDLIQCHTMEEMDEAMNLQRQGTNYQDIVTAISQ